MAMGRCNREQQPTIWITTTDLPTAVSHPFHSRLNRLLREHGCDDFAEAQCAAFYAKTMGRPSLPPGISFRLLVVGDLEGIDSERGGAWRGRYATRLSPSTQGHEPRAAGSAGPA